MNTKINREILQDDRQILVEYTKWLETAEFVNLPQAVHYVLARGKNSLEDSVKFYEKLVDEHTEEDFLPFADEEYLIEDEEFLTSEMEVAR
jgi:hypothetical protein